MAYVFQTLEDSSGMWFFVLFKVNRKLKKKKWIMSKKPGSLSFEHWGWILEEKKITSNLRLQSVSKWMEVENESLSS